MEKGYELEESLSGYSFFHGLGKVLTQEFGKRGEKLPEVSQKEIPRLHCPKGMLQQGRACLKSLISVWPSFYLWEYLFKKPDLIQLPKARACPEFTESRKELSADPLPGRVHEKFFVPPDPIEGFLFQAELESGGKAESPEHPQGVLAEGLL